MALLETRLLTKQFGGLTAVKNVSIQINEGEIIGLIGPNGAGKTTLFNLVTGVFPPTGGNIMFKGSNIAGLKPHQVAKRGIVRTFQLTKLFAEYSVIKNVLMAQHLHCHIGFWGALFMPPSSRRREAILLRQAKEILDLLGLSERKNELAKNMPHGHQRALGIGMALAAQPELLLLDEPTAGMNPEESITMMQRIQNIAHRGITVLLIEHDMKVVMGLCQRIIVLNYGSKIAEGGPQEIKENNEVIQAYLGAPNAAAED
jgi:branched-chain amino acid transport system ATP-binding protein